MRPFIGITPDYSNETVKLKQVYIEALNDAGFDICILPVLSDVRSIVERFDGIVISGGDDIHPSCYGEEPISGLKIIDRKRTDFEIKLLKECIEHGKPVLGICNGMQTMNVALGGTLLQDIEGGSSVEINHKKGYHTITVGNNEIIEKGNYKVNTAHHQAIRNTGKGVSVLAVSEDGIIEAISVDGPSFAVGVQWHPERDPDSEINRMLFNSFRESCIARN
ncbi:MAG: type 1 glutamine amidotransferase [Thermodesulfovibrionales bacterium]